MDKRFWGVVIAIIIIFIGIFAITSHNNKGSSSGNGTATNHIEGQGQDGVTLVEYGDYQCPFCGQYFSTVKQVASLYNQYIYFQFRNLPLTQLHPNAFAGARAAEAAALQNQFWQMHDLLYENQNSWASASDPLSIYDQFAQQLGLNVSKFNQDFGSDQVNNSINADVSAFTATGAQEATPTFFLDGKQISPGVFYNNGSINASATLSNFENDINAEIQKKTGKASPVTPNATSTPTTSNTPTQSTQ